MGFSIILVRPSPAALHGNAYIIPSNACGRGRRIFRPLMVDVHQVHVLGNFSIRTKFPNLHEIPIYSLERAFSFKKFNGNGPRNSLFSRLQ